MVKPEIAEPLPGSFSPRAHGFTFTHFDTRAPLIFSERIFARLSFTDIQTDKPLKTPSKNSFRFLLQLFRRWSILDPLKGQDTMKAKQSFKESVNWEFVHAHHPKSSGPVKPGPWADRIIEHAKSNGFSGRITKLGACRVINRNLY